MSFDVGRFLAVVNEVGGFQSPSKFSVRVFPRVPSDGRLLEFLCHTVDVPDVTVAATAVRPLGYGYTRQAALVPVYQQSSLVFYDDNAKVAWRFLSEWRERVVSTSYEPGGSETADSSGRLPFQLSYMDDYVARVVVSTFDQSGNLNRQVVLHDAWPSSVGPTRLSWDSRDQVSVIPVSLNYSTFTVTDLNEQ